MNHFETINDLIEDREELEEMKKSLAEKGFWWQKHEKKVKKDKKKDKAATAKKQTLPLVAL